MKIVSSGDMKVYLMSQELIAEINRICQFWSVKTNCYNILNALRDFVSKILTVKGQGLIFKLSHLQDPQYSVKSGHIQ